MAIGTSLGAYYESDFHHQAGIDTPPEVKEPSPDSKKDRNELDPGEIAPKDNPVPIRVSDKYDTPLASTDADKYTEWKKQNAPDDTGADYDLQGAFKAGLSPAENGHFPDTFKKPSHPTFSDESQYSTPDQPGGHWDQDGDKWTFTPSSTNIQQNGIKGIQEYLKKSDPDVKLNLPNIEDVKPKDIIDKLTGANNTERYQLWPERMVRDALETVHNVSSGKVPMWGYDPDSGEMHTTQEGMEAAQDLMPFAVGGNRGLPTTVHLQGPGADAINEGPDAFRQFMSTRGNRQPSNIEGEVLPPEPPASPNTPVWNDFFTPRGRPADHPDFTDTVNEYHQALVDHSNSNPNEAWQPRGIRAGESLRDFAEREVERADPELRTHGHPQEHPDPYEQEPLEAQDIFGDMPHPDENIHDRFRREADASMAAFERQRQTEVQQIQKSFEDNPEQVIKNRGVSFKPQPHGNPENRYRSFHFMNEEGNVGEMSIQSKDGGKRLWVPWMGSIGTPGPQDIGPAEIRAIIPIIKRMYPNAEEIGGFRVSGARSVSGRTGDAFLKLHPKAQAAE